MFCYVGLQVVSLQQSEWRRMKTQQDRVYFLWQLAQGVTVGTPGIPHIVKVVVPEAEAVANRSKPGIAKQLWRLLLEGH